MKHENPFLEISTCFVLSQSTASIGRGRHSMVVTVSNGNHRASSTALACGIPCGLTARQIRMPDMEEAVLVAKTSFVAMYLL